MATSVIAAVLTKVSGFAGMPYTVFGDAPPANGATQIYPPYVVLMDEGLQANYETEYSVQEVSTITFMVYAPTLEAVDAIAMIIKYNGGETNEQLGLDFGTLPALVAPYSLQSMVRTSERGFVASVGGTGDAGQRVHGRAITYSVAVYVYNQSPTPP